jgi:hypothetical protein
MKTLIIILITVALMVVFFFVHRSNEQEARSWAESKGKVLRSDTHWTPVGTPYYWVPKGGMIYEFEILLPSGKKETWFVRTGQIYGFDYEKGE